MTSTPKPHSDLPIEPEETADDEVTIQESKALDFDDDMDEHVHRGKE